MSKLTRKKKFPPPYDDRNTKTQNVLTHKRIFQRAISSADKHGIKLKPGRENEGNGNCSYEAAIFNINERSCFTEKFLMSPDFYRRIWNIDMLNKILCKENDWNPGLTDVQRVLQSL